METTGSTTSKERPILFNAEMVNAILSGRKTQTRRIMKVQPEYPELGLRRIIESTNSDDIGKYFWSQSDACGINKTRSKAFPCPLGQAGDQLWVRECFSDLEDFEFFNPSVPDVISGYWYWADGNPEWGNWTKPKPSIHMPRWASRINLLITGVRVERLNDISELDAKAEGCAYGKGNGEIDLAVRPENHFPTLWASIYGEESWQANPWVWVINFERMEAK
ncbi:TPA: hypothetical protein ACX4EX_001628 [Yersinia enterocolitica]|uniref:hypothetical protein n=1 Tax=Yersinia enterocolitica TaxID=630 RepID=UPI0005FCDEEF|nr:hypothetical protein [Yersinia enterocolitica]EKN5933360.1 hypothetical protein [Yersinia enterocolitica]CRE89909.1 phage-like protein [Yersinia enterocolitica]HDL7350188.1 hypothetical protein [Yersinia enterocolitica]